MGNHEQVCYPYDFVKNYKTDAQEYLINTKYTYASGHLKIIIIKTDFLCSLEFEHTIIRLSILLARAG